MRKRKNVSYLICTSNVDNIIFCYVFMFLEKKNKSETIKALLLEYIEKNLEEDFALIKKSGIIQELIETGSFKKKILETITTSMIPLVEPCDVERIKRAIEKSRLKQGGFRIDDGAVKILFYTHQTI